MAGHRFRFFLLGSFLFLAHCNPAGSGSPSFATEPQVEIDLEAIQKRGYLQALVDNNSVSYFILKGSPMGYEYELLKRLADHLRVELKIKIITGIEQAIDQLNKGEGDVLAFPLTITTDRQQYVAFSEAHFTTHQVLVQKKPANWRMQPPAVVEKKLIRNPVGLIGQPVHVMKGSSFEQRMRNLSQEVGGPIDIIPDSASAETESLIRKVAMGEIKYTVTDQTLAMVNALYFPNLDINTVVSLPQQIGWAVRKNSPALLGAIDRWMQGIKKSGVYQVIFNKYFDSPRFSLTRIHSDYSSLAGKSLSPYDNQIKAGAEALGWDWRLLASVVYQESNFDPNVKSWAGAIGLMQVMPETGKYFGVENLWNPEMNIRVGVRFLKFLDNQWSKSINNPEERIKFVLASYNVGLTHVLDARNLTRKYGQDPTLWADVESFLLKKSDPKYYRDPVAAAGYCRCTGPVEYVKEVLSRFEEYKLHIDPA
ncbi:MAG: transporter substrate-binding domain-containing protein [Cyclobacteriaceae bacterium]|nr:transporter substrate-binding domain-containing protein [Cyclobacteriaceae bacterium]